jgi:hypothetical protein
MQFKWGGKKFTENLHGRYFGKEIGRHRKRSEGDRELDPEETVCEDGR